MSAGKIVGKVLALPFKVAGVLVVSLLQTAVSTENATRTEYQKMAGSSDEDLRDTITNSKSSHAERMAAARRYKERHPEMSSHQE